MKNNSDLLEDEDAWGHLWDFVKQAWRAKGRRFKPSRTEHCQSNRTRQLEPPCGGFDVSGHVANKTSSDLIFSELAITWTRFVKHQ